MAMVEQPHWLKIREAEGSSVAEGSPITANGQEAKDFRSQFYLLYRKSGFNCFSGVRFAPAIRTHHFVV
jgi:hypothetical protein